MEALSASKAETSRMLDSVLANHSSRTHTGATEYLTEMDNIILTWIYRVHRKNFEKALGALRAIETDDITVQQKNAIESVKRYVTTMKEVEDSDIVQIVFEENNNATDDSRVIISTFSGHPLKPLVKLYAKKRGVSVKSLQFSYKGKMIFMTDVMNKYLNTIGMQDHDVIMVHHESDSNKEIMVDNSNRQLQRKTKKKKKSKVVRNNESKLNKEKVKQDKPAIPSIEDYKRQHSMILSKLHNEVQLRLKDIRMRLNALDLERQPPKSKNKGIKKSAHAKEGPDDQMLLPESSLGGKAGKAYFVVQVGEVQNLYKTTKTSALTSLLHGQSCLPTLDLHGCTRMEAIVKLNESLKVWVDSAMRGYDPFVITAVIVCGCGSQVLSETVQEWIKSSSQVRNAPKSQRITQ
ncbi:hypothetical protein ACHAW5_008506 [Stephanodiscus triporus]|uniref:Smr domain-containing protein n=1 Tax=Stephanodiscus triporus TaxID=2934178 RepID=A0ABD3N0E9_9STRA